MQNPFAPPVVLASSSPYRRELLGRLLADFGCMAPEIDEAPRPGEPPRDLVRRLARQKADALSGGQPGALLIGADQVAVLEGRAIGKPGNHARAVEQLLAASGKTMLFLTAACVLDRRSGHRHEHTDVTQVTFRLFDRPLAEAYLRHDAPYDCAGSFRIEGAGVVLFESVSTDDPTALIGLPMIWLASVLRELGCLQPSGAGPGSPENY
ncbi:MAG TPA: Maf family protein [Woeseiaceae bacterium]|nr:Maf family protein [Woeseiaceae bacterium]